MPRQHDGIALTAHGSAMSAVASRLDATYSQRTMICMTAPNLDDATLDRLSQLSMSADPPPWRSMIEGRDHLSGDSFIMIGPDGDRREDLYVSRDSGAADPSTLDLLAEARTYLPVLIAEVKRLRALGRG